MIKMAVDGQMAILQMAVVLIY